MTFNDTGDLWHPVPKHLHGSIIWQTPSTVQNKSVRRKSLLFSYNDPWLIVDPKGPLNTTLCEERNLLCFPIMTQNDPKMTLEGLDLIFLNTPRAALRKYYNYDKTLHGAIELWRKADFCFHLTCNSSTCQVTHHPTIILFKVCLVADDTVAWNRFEHLWTDKSDRYSTHRTITNLAKSYLPWFWESMLGGKHNWIFKDLINSLMSFDAKLQTK